MTAFIFSFVLLIIGIVVGAMLLGYGKENDEVGFMRLSAVPFSLGVILFVILLCVSMIVSIPTGHTGVVTTFGRVEDTVLDAGIHSKAPWQKVVKMDNRVQKENVSLSCFSSDIQEVEVSYTVNYQIDKRSAPHIYQTVGTSYYATVIEPSIAESVKVIVAQYTAENLVASRDVLASSIEDLLEQQLASYNIIVVGTAIEDIDFTDGFTAAVEAKQVAAQNKLKAQTEQEQATMEAQQQAERDQIQARAAAEVAKIQAQADLEVTKIQADAAEYAGQKEAAKNAAIAASLSQDLLKYYYIEQWNGELPDSYVGSDNVSAIIMP